MRRTDFYDPLDCTTPEDKANGVSRVVTVSDSGTWHEHVSLGGVDALRLEPATTHEMQLPERWR